MRVKIEFPAESPRASFELPVRIGDINYGGHLGNDSVLSLIQEARMQLLAKGGFTELEAGGHGLIMADVQVAYRGESFYGDVLLVEVFVSELDKRSFNFLYRVSTQRDGMRIPVADARTGMVCFDYKQRKITAIGEALKTFLEAKSE
jgi:acyl-CoA thioesterase FadM